MNIQKLERELAAAGLRGLPVSWNDAGEIIDGTRLTKAQRDAFEAVVAAHDPRPDAAEDRRNDRRQALQALVGTPDADAALDGFFRSIKTRPDLPAAVRDYIQKHEI